MSITMADLIGEDAASLQPSQVSTFNSRGLNVMTWKYDAPGGTTTTRSVPVICLHGGPAFPHNYILPLKLLTHKYGYSCIFYDQAGCGKSDFDRCGDPENSAPWLFTLDYYIEEFMSLVNHYQLTEYHIYGSSWGTIVAQEIGVRGDLKLKSLPHP
jgi:pimeloyl-ACP methyl ester carboxylesterase